MQASSSSSPAPDGVSPVRLLPSSPAAGPRASAPAELYITFSFKSSVETFYYLSEKLMAIAPALNELLDERGVGWCATHRSTASAEELIFSCEDVEEALATAAPFLGFFDLFCGYSDCGTPRVSVVGRDGNGGRVGYKLSFKDFMNGSGDLIVL